MSLASQNGQRQERALAAGFAADAIEDFAHGLDFGPTQFIDLPTLDRAIGGDGKGFGHIADIDWLEPGLRPISGRTGR